MTAALADGGCLLAVEPAPRVETWRQLLPRYLSRVVIGFTPSWFDRLMQEEGYTQARFELEEPMGNIFADYDDIDVLTVFSDLEFLGRGHRYRTTKHRRVDTACDGLRSCSVFTLSLGRAGIELLAGATEFIRHQSPLVAIHAGPQTGVVKEWFHANFPDWSVLSLRGWPAGPGYLACFPRGTLFDQIRPERTDISAQELMTDASRIAYLKGLYLDSQGQSLIWNGTTEKFGCVIDGGGGPGEIYVELQGASPHGVRAFVNGRATVASSDSRFLRIAHSESAEYLAVQISPIRLSTIEKNEPMSIRRLRVRNFANLIGPGI